MARPNDFICTAKTCFNSKVTHPSLGFFSFPNDPAICKIWLDNCQRPDLSVDNVVIQRDLYKLCSDHFEHINFCDSSKRYFSHRFPNLHPIPTIFGGKPLELPSIDNVLENTSLDVPDEHMNAALEEKALQGDFASDLVHTELLVKCPWPVSYSDVPLSKMSERDTLAQSVLSLSPSTEVHHIESLCRLCMNLASDDSIEIFVNTAEALEIRRMFQIVLPNRVQLCDGLPQRICRKCIPDLKTCGKLMDKFKKADRYLRQIEKYSLFIEDDEIGDIAEDNNSSTDKDFIQPVPKKGLVIPLDRFNTRTALVQKSLGIWNSTNSNEFSPNEISLVCVNVVNAKGEEELREHSSTKMVNQMYNENETYTNDGKMTDTIPLGETEDTSKENQENHNPNLITNDCLKGIINSSNIEPSARLSYKCLECKGVLESYPFLVDHILACHRPGSELERQRAKMRKKRMEAKRTQSLKEMQRNPSKPVVKKIIRFCRKDVYVPPHREHHCSMCPRVFTSAVRLQNHEAWHNDRRQCDKCGLTFKTGWKRRQHEASHTSEQSRICEICGILLPTNRTFESHMRVHTVYTCETCGKQLNSYRTYLNHRQNHSKVHKCNICNRRFATSRCFEKHKMICVNATTVSLVRTPKVNSVCEFCGTKIRKYSLKRHLMLRAKLGYCPRRSQKKRNKDEGKQHVCDICGKRFARSKNLQSHKQNHFRNGDPATILQQDKEAQHYCDVCGMKFVKLNNMQNHRRLHFCNGDPAAIQILLEVPEIQTCEVCKKVYFSRLTLLNHSQKHTGSNKPYDCLVCGNTFDTIKNYRIHERLEHTKDHPYECSHCDKKFIMKSLLKNHEKNHPRKSIFSRIDGFYVCNTCNMKFKSKYGVIMHSKITHEGVTYVCKICNKDCKTRSKLDYHSQKHTGKRPTCQLCHKTFIHKYALGNHMRKIHKIEKKSNTEDNAKENIEISEEDAEGYLENDIEEVDQDSDEQEAMEEEEMRRAVIDNFEKDEHDFEPQVILNEDSQLIDFDNKTYDEIKTQEMSEETKEAVQYVILSDDQEIEYIISSPNYTFS